MNNRFGQDSMYAPLCSDAEAMVIEAVPIVSKQSVEVRSPMTLAGGYELTVEVGGNRCVVLVPEGGVQEGDLFHAEILHDVKDVVTSKHSINANPDPHNIPVGSWRDGICSCCSLGFCHPVLCLVTWCPVLALGQLMTRMNLTPCGNSMERGTAYTYWTPFKVMALVLCAWFFFSYCVSYVVSSHTIQAAEDHVPPPAWVGAVSFVHNCVYLLFAIFVFMANCKTRSRIRRAYGIPESIRSGFDDICTTFCCGGLSVAQMLRHTADYRAYHASCCSETGLNDSAPSPTSPHVV